MDEACDIEALKRRLERVEAARRESEQKYRSLFDNMADGLAVCAVERDETGRVVDLVYRQLNAAMGPQAGVSREAFVGRRLSEVSDQAEFERWISIHADVVETGEPATAERHVAATGRWSEVSVFRSGQDELSIFVRDITGRKRADAKSALLAGIADDLARSATLDEIIDATGARMGQALNLNLCLFVDVDDAQDEVVVHHAWRSDEGRGVRQRFRIGAFLTDAFVGAQRAGEVFVVGDALAEEGIDAGASARLSIGAILAAPFHRDGRWAACLVVTDPAPRDWRGDEIEVVREVAERVFSRIEQVRAEAAMRESERKYRKLFESMDEAYAVVEVLKDDKGKWVDFRFLEVNQAFLEHTTMPWPVGKTATELLGEPNPRWTQLYGQALDTNAPLRVEEPEGKLGLVFDLNIFALDREQNRVAVLFTNISQRKKAEAALRESEGRFQQFADASSATLWIRDAATLHMEYVSAAVSNIYGVKSDAFLGDIRHWASTILPEDREMALRRIGEAQQGRAVVHEFRIQCPSDGSFRWIRSTDFPLFDAAGRVQRIGGVAEDVTEAKLSVEHQGVLLAELQHRVRNIMAIIRAIATRTGERAETVPDYAQRITGRLMALARVQALITQKADGGVRLAPLIHDEVSVQAHHEGQYDLAGPDVLLSPKAAEVLTLAVHELATNALKHGALSVEAGKVTVRWSVADRLGASWLVFDWTETGAPLCEVVEDQPRRRGFGTELIQARIPYELGGVGRIDIRPGGARCHLEFPIQDGASALETGAPQRATVYGGTLDMTGEARLDGAAVLVVEDEYYIATDTARALQGAGADVMGPYRSEHAARMAIGERRPDAAVLDVNLGGGPWFKLAEALKDQGVPFVFVTGYDQQVIPDEFSDVERLEKPVPLRRIVGAVAGLLTTL